MEQSDARPNGHSSVVSALGHVLNASEHVIADRIEVARLDALEAISHALAEAALRGFGAVLVLCGWLSLSAVAVLTLASVLSLAAGLAIMGGVNGALGAGLLAYGRRSTTQSEARA